MLVIISLREKWRLQIGSFTTVEIFFKVTKDKILGEEFLMRAWRKTMFVVVDLHVQAVIRKALLLIKRGEFEVLKFIEDDLFVTYLSYRTTHLKTD